MTKSNEKQALSRIYGNGRGWAFSPKDFADLGRIDMALNRLIKKGTIRRVIRGIYDYPRYSELLQQELGPDIHQVAKALARKFGWRIEASGQSAANLIGITTQIPSQYIYQSDGPNRNYQIDKTTLQFKHINFKEIGFKTDESALIVHAIRSLGESNITPKIVSQIRTWLPAKKRKRVLKDTERVTGWVFSAIKKICREDRDG